MSLSERAGIAYVAADVAQEVGAQAASAGEMLSRVLFARCPFGEAFGGVQLRMFGAAASQRVCGDARRVSRG